MSYHHPNNDFLLYSFLVKILDDSVNKLGKVSEKLTVITKENSQGFGLCKNNLTIR